MSSRAGAMTSRITTRISLVNSLTTFIRERAAELGYTTGADLARAGGLSTKMVSEYLSGSVPRRMHEATARRWAAALEVPVNKIREVAGMPGSRFISQLTVNHMEHADSLSQEQIDVVLETIRIFGEANTAVRRGV